MEWIGDGKRDPEIAAILGVSRRTVEKHAAHIFVKLKVETRTAAFRSCQLTYFAKVPFSRALGKEEQARHQPKVFGPDERQPY